MGTGKILPMMLQCGAWATYIGPLRPNAGGRWPEHGLCRIVATPHDPGHRAGLSYVITFPSRDAEGAEFHAFFSELLPVAEPFGGSPGLKAAG